MKKRQCKTLFWCLQVLAVCGLGLSQIPGARAQEPEAPSLVVTTKSDTTANDGQTTLREAISYARSLPAAQNPTVTFAPAVTGTITLDGSNINISRPAGSKLTISGPGASVLSLNGNAQSNIFYSDGVGNALLSGLTLTNGLARSGGAIDAIPNAANENFSGTLEITDCVFSNNRATFEAGAINAGCVVRLLRCSFINNRSDNYQGAVQFYSYPEFVPSSATDCVFSGNTARGLGGAVAVYGDGNTAFTGCVFSNNSATGESYNQGGALQIDADLDDSVTLTGCTFSNNTSSGQGGAINVNTCASLRLTDTWISNNSAATGGGLSVTKTFSVDFIRSALTGNTASGDGGGIYTEAALNFTNSTVSGNTADGSGGGIYLNNLTQPTTKLSAQFTTIAANSAANGGGIYLGDNRTGNLARLIVAGNTAATNPDVRGAFTSGGFNVIGKVGSATGFLSSDRTGTSAAPLDARLGALTNNGGPTPTHALLTGSPALDLATPVAGITTDQRGVARPGSGNVDAGAFEAAPIVLVLDLNGNLAGTGVTTDFTEQTPLIVAPALTISGVTTLDSASVQLNENPDNALETLSANVAGTQITATYNAATRTLALSGADTVEHFRHVLAGVTYNDLSDTPHPANRTLLFSISGEGQSQSATATLQVLAVNDAPVALAQTLSTNEDTPLNITLGATDVDTPLANLTFGVVAAPSHGTLSGTGANLIYTPNADFNGEDAFTFQSSDGPNVSQPAQISLQVLAVNDAPVAQPQTLSTDEDTPLNITLGATDVDSETLSFSIVSGPQHGTLSGSAPNLIYTPNTNFNGADGFTFIANDGSAQSGSAKIDLQVLAVNDAPIAIAQQLSADNRTPLNITLSATDVDSETLSFTIVSGPQHGTLSGSAPNLVYTANPGFRGSDSLVFGVSDGTANSQATIGIAVTGIGAVSAADDSYDLVLGAPGQPQQSGVVFLSTNIFQITAPGLLANDTFAPGSTLTLRAVSIPQHGRFQLRNDGTLFYVANSGRVGVDEFTYALSDGFTTATARVRLNLIDRNAPELAFDAPRDRDIVDNITQVIGRVRDRNSGLKSLTLLWQRFDGKFWNGTAWSSTAVKFPLTVQGTNWSYAGNLPAPGINASSDLIAGRYDLRITATDNSDNIKLVTNRIIVRRTAPPPVFSTVRLSAAGASAAQNTLELRFTGALDATSARDVTNYAMTINGVETKISAANYANNLVTLSGFTVRLSDKIRLQISGLRDATNKPLQGGTINVGVH